MNSCGSCAGVGLQETLIWAAHKQLQLAVRKARKLAEKKTRKLKVGGVPYSPKLQQYAIRSSSGHWSISTPLLSLSVD
jgi:hypothetical protein